jgi:hypothetical protein
MTYPASPIRAALRSRCPSRRIGVELPLATIEELDFFGARNHLSREQILRQLINAPLLNDAPHWPADPEPVGQLAEHAHLTLVRSHELAAVRGSDTTTTTESQTPPPDTGSSSE